jgi:hypothetical protein
VSVRRVRHVRSVALHHVADALVDGLLQREHGLLRARLVVHRDDLDLAAEDATLGIDAVRRVLEVPETHFTGVGKGPGQAFEVGDLDGALGVGAERKRALENTAMAPAIAVREILLSMRFSSSSVTGVRMSGPRPNASVPRCADHFRPAQHRSMMPVRAVGRLDHAISRGKRRADIAIRAPCPPNHSDGPPEDPSCRDFPSGVGGFCRIAPPM